MCLCIFLFCWKNILTNTFRSLKPRVVLKMSRTYFVLNLEFIYKSETNTFNILFVPLAVILPVWHYSSEGQEKAVRLLVSE